MRLHALLTRLTQWTFKTCSSLSSPHVLLLSATMLNERLYTRLGLALQLCCNKRYRYLEREICLLIGIEPPSPRSEECVLGRK